MGLRALLLANVTFSVVTVPSAVGANAKRVFVWKVIAARTELLTSMERDALTNRRRKNGNLCMTGADSLCHISYPVSDFKKARSEAAVCRTVPQDYIDGEYEYVGFTVKDSDNGLCAYGCEEYDNENKCKWSWPAGETKFLNPKAMFRCLPKDE